MLVLTRRVGESVLIGESVLTVRTRRCGMVLVSLEVPAETPVEIDGAQAKPAGVMPRVHSHLHWLLCGEPLRIGEAVVRIGSAQKRAGARRGGRGQMSIAVDAPPALRILRAECGSNSPRDATDPHPMTTTDREAA